jgi:alpha-ketoglutarate-dependent taurine dioxygenase
MSYPITSAPPLPVQTHPGKPPLVLAQAGGRAADWTAAHRDVLHQMVRNHGALLVRGLGLRSHAEIGDVFRAYSGGRLLPERESFAPRTAHQPGVFSSTKWPANQQMCMHHEQSYATDFPGTMMFACLTAPGAGGATAVADATAVLNALPRDLVARFEHEGWMLVRNYNDEIGSSYAEAFGTADPAAVEHYCRANGIEFEWLPGDGLRTRQRRSAIARHPVTGQFSWFNQIAFLNEWTLEPDVREFLVDTYGSDGLPFNTRFGSGAPIGPDIVQLLNSVYEAHTRREPWQPGDLLLVDNIRTAHAREAYEGPREVLVGMTDPVNIAAIAPQGGQR